MERTRERAVFEQLDARVLVAVSMLSESEVARLRKVDCARVKLALMRAPLRRAMMHVLCARAPRRDTARLIPFQNPL